MSGCGWNFKRSGWNFGVELDQLSLPYIIVLKSFVVNFLGLGQVAFKLFFFFSCVVSKTMCLVVNPERRWQP